MFRTMNIFCFMLSFLWGHFIVSQGYCESRDTMYDQRANSVL